MTTKYPLAVALAAWLLFVSATPSNGREQKHRSYSLDDSGPQPKSATRSGLVLKTGKTGESALVVPRTGYPTSRASGGPSNNLNKGVAPSIASPPPLANWDTVPKAEGTPESNLKPAVQVVEVQQRVATPGIASAPPTAQPEYGTTSTAVSSAVGGGAPGALPGGGIPQTQDSDKVKALEKENQDLKKKVASLRQKQLLQSLKQSEESKAKVSTEKSGEESYYAKLSRYASAGPNPDGPKFLVLERKNKNGELETKLVPFTGDPQKDLRALGEFRGQGFNVTPVLSKDEVKLARENPGSATEEFLARNHDNYDRIAKAQRALAELPVKQGPDRAEQR